MNLHERSNEELLSEIAALVGSERELLAKLVANLAELEERRLHLHLGYSSMFDFCQKKLRISESEAFRRILAARLGRRFPVVFPLLASGDVKLSTLELLRPYVTDENHDELLTAVTGKGKRDVQSLLAARFPRPDRPSSIRRTMLEPLSDVSYRVEFTATKALREKLERCRNLMSHANPSGDLAVILERSVDLLLADLERKRLGRTTRPRQAHRERVKAPAGIASATRREVYERDGSQCTYVAKDGRRCEARAFLELDRAVARALGGSNDSKNLRVRCRAHNQLAAEQTFGRERIDWIRRFRQTKSTAAPSEPPPTHDATARRHLSEARPVEGSPGAAILEKVRVALRGMGFRNAQAEYAIAAVARMHDSGDPPTLEQVLREALLVATAA